MDGWPAFLSGQCRGRSWPNAYGRDTRGPLSRRSSIVHSFIHSLTHSLTHSFIDQSVMQGTNTVPAIAILTTLLCGIRFIAGSS